MVRMKALVLSGVIVYAVILLVLHRTFMGGHKDDALVHAILRDQSRRARGHAFLMGSGGQVQNFLLIPNLIQDTFNLGLKFNITDDLKSVQKVRNFSSYHILTEWSKMMSGIVHNGVLQQLSPGDTSMSFISRLEETPRYLTYPNFNFTLPNLESQEGAKLFMLNYANRQTIGAQKSERLVGSLGVLHNVTVHQDTDCGYKTKVKNFYPKQKAKLRKDFIIDGVVIPLLVPDSHAFQHFIDGLLPKLMQVLDLALLPGVQLLIFYPRDAIIFEILEELGIPKKKIIYYPNHLLHLKTVINTCITPPVHPVLWNTARRLLKVPEGPPNPKDSVVILLTRAGSYNLGRNMINIREVKNLLSMRYRSRLIIFKGAQNLKKSRALFSRAAIILGVHGGAFYNLMLAPRTTHIIEFMPFDSLGNPLPGTAHQIFWLQTQMIGQPYWRMQLTPQTTGDIKVPISNLTAILDKIDTAIKTRPYTGTAIKTRPNTGTAIETRPSTEI